MIYIGPYKKPENDYYKEFTRIFGRKLTKYWDVLTGFKLLEFDHDIETPKDKSTEDHVRENYGQDGVDLIYKLLE